MKYCRTHLSNKAEVLYSLWKYTKVLDGHWRWIGGSVTPNGHARYEIEGRSYFVHRLSAYVHLGFDLSSKKEILHKDVVCPFPDCWHPEHIYIGTHGDNAADRSIKVDALPTYPCGHARTESNTYRSQHLCQPGGVQKRCRVCTVKI